MKARGLGRSSENLLDLDQESLLSTDIEQQQHSDTTPASTEETSAGESYVAETAMENVEQASPLIETTDEILPELKTIVVEVKTEEVSSAAVEETPVDNASDDSNVENLTNDVEEQQESASKPVEEEGVQLIQIETTQETIVMDGGVTSSTTVVVETAEAGTTDENETEPSSLVDINNDNNNVVTTTTTTTVAWQEKLQEDELVATEEKLAQLNLESDAPQPDTTSSEITPSSDVSPPAEESTTTNGHEVSEIQEQELLLTLVVHAWCSTSVHYVVLV